MRSNSWARRFCKKEAHPELRLDDIRANIDGSGHSLGGALYELSAKFWGTSGMNIDGPGVSAQAGRSEFAGLKAEFRAKEGLVALQDNYTWSPGEFQARRYSVVGDTGTHLSGVEVYTSPQYTELSQAANDINSYYLLVPGVRVKHAAAEPMTKAIASSSWHPISEILKAEGYPNPCGALQEQYIARNLSLGLSASGYANGSMQYEVKGGGISFRVDVYRDDQGSMVEIRHAGRWVNGQFQILAPGWTTKATPSGMLINVGVDDPATGVSTPSVDSAAGLGTTRISANYITDNGAGSHTVTVGAGGTVSDIWLLQTRAGNDLGSLADFGRAIKANNRHHRYQQGVARPVIYVPQKSKPTTA
ncbi:MAG: hypothetical protein IPF55_03440 [Rhodoferax sp.]|nr:hypothetical protein [Rhodoferax sp.]